MQKILWIVGSTFGSAIGWWFGDLVGGITTAYIISSIGAIAGVIAGIKLARHLE